MVGFAVQFLVLAIAAGRRHAGCSSLRGLRDRVPYGVARRSWLLVEASVHRPLLHPAQGVGVLG
jgi:hypothetical protein